MSSDLNAFFKDVGGSACSFWLRQGQRTMRYQSRPVEVEAMQARLEAIPIAGMAYYNRIIVLIGINITLAVSLNIINGHAGQFSLGHAGFMAIGAYTTAMMSAASEASMADAQSAAAYSTCMAGGGT